MTSWKILVNATKFRILEIGRLKRLGDSFYEQQNWCVHMELIILSQWNEYIRGWQLLIESGDQIFWTILILVAWVVRAISLTMILIQLGDRLIRKKKDFEFNLLLTGIIFILATVPFFLAGLPLIYPFVP